MSGANSVDLITFISSTADRIINEASARNQINYNVVPILRNWIRDNLKQIETALISKYAHGDPDNARLNPGDIERELFGYINQGLVMLTNTQQMQSNMYYSQNQQNQYMNPYMNPNMMNPNMMNQNGNQQIGFITPTGFTQTQNSQHNMGINPFYTGSDNGTTLLTESDTDVLKDNIGVSHTTKGTFKMVNQKLTMVYDDVPTPDKTMKPDATKVVSKYGNLNIPYFRKFNNDIVFLKNSDGSMHFADCIIERPVNDLVEVIRFAYDGIEDFIENRYGISLFYKEMHGLQMESNQIAIILNKIRDYDVDTQYGKVSASRQLWQFIENVLIVDEDRGRQMETVFHGWFLNQINEALKYRTIVSKFINPNSADPISSIQLSSLSEFEFLTWNREELHASGDVDLINILDEYHEYGKAFYDAIDDASEFIINNVLMFSSILDMEHNLSDVMHCDDMFFVTEDGVTSWDVKEIGDIPNSIREILPTVIAIRKQLLHTDLKADMIDCMRIDSYIVTSEIESLFEWMIEQNLKKHLTVVRESVKRGGFDIIECARTLDGFLFFQRIR